MKASKTRPNVIQIRVSDTELALIEKQAHESGVNRTEYIRNMICFGQAQKDKRVAAMFSAVMQPLCNAANDINSVCYEIKRAIPGNPSLADLSEKFDALNQSYDYLVELYEDAFLER